MEKKNVGILGFDGMETLDFAGPFEVFSVTGQREGDGHFNVFLISENPGPVLAVNGLSVNPHYTIFNSPEIDILIIPGGVGARKVLKNMKLLQWIKETSSKTELTLSVCTGSLILGQLGILDNLVATTHHECIDLLKELAPKTKVKDDERFIDNGRVLVAAGISAGIDMSLYVIEKLLGKKQALETANYMEYPYLSSK